MRSQGKQRWGEDGEKVKKYIILKKSFFSLCALRKATSEGDHAVGVEAETGEDSMIDVETMTEGSLFVPTAGAEAEAAVHVGEVLDHVDATMNPGKAETHRRDLAAQHGSSTTAATLVETLMKAKVKARAGIGIGATREVGVEVKTVIEMGEVLTIVGAEVEV